MGFLFAGVIPLVILTFAFGAIIGSFLNVVILRLNTGRGFGGRSLCFSCGKTLRPRHLVPIASYLVLGGKCASCKRRISWQYPLIEILTGIIFALCAMQYGPLLLAGLVPTFVAAFMWSGAVFSVLLVIAVYDIRHKIIPDSMALLFAILGLVKVFLMATSHGLALTFVPLHLLAGPALAAPFALLWLVSKGRLMGLGDAKLAVGIGFLLGFSGGIAALMLAFWIGALCAVGLLLMRAAKLTIKSEIPFAPFLAFGTALAFFAHIDLSTLARIFAW